MARKTIMEIGCRRRLRKRMSVMSKQFMQYRWVFLHNQFAPPQQSLVLLPTIDKMRFFAFTVWISLGLSERLFLCFKSFDWVLGFCFDCGMFQFVTVEIEKHERVKNESEKEGERKNYYFIKLGIILRVKQVWSCYNNCYSALQIKRATVANLKIKNKKIEMERWLEDDFSVFALLLRAYWKCSKFLHG